MSIIHPLNQDQIALKRSARCIWETGIRNMWRLSSVIRIFIRHRPDCHCHPSPWSSSVIWIASRHRDHHPLSVIIIRYPSSSLSSIIQIVSRRHVIVIRYLDCQLSSGLSTVIRIVIRYLDCQPSPCDRHPLSGISTVIRIVIRYLDCQLSSRSSAVAMWSSSVIWIVNCHPDRHPLSGLSTVIQIAIRCLDCQLSSQSSSVFWIVSCHPDCQLSSRSSSVIWIRSCHPLSGLSAVIQIVGTHPLYQ